jgi:hypothetical protein
MWYKPDSLLGSRSSCCGSLSWLSFLSLVDLVEEVVDGSDDGSELDCRHHDAGWARALLCVAEALP